MTSINNDVIVNRASDSAAYFNQWKLPIVRRKLVQAGTFMYVVEGSSLGTSKEN